MNMKCPAAINKSDIVRSRAAVRNIDIPFPQCLLVKLLSAGKDFTAYEAQHYNSITKAKVRFAHKLCGILSQMARLCGEENKICADGRETVCPGLGILRLYVI